MFTSRAARALVQAQIQWVGFAFKKANTTLSSEVHKRLRPHQVVLLDGDIIVTNAGFVTMAIHSNYASLQDGDLAVPGVDCRGQRGFLVLCESSAPYHSLANTPQHAFAEAKRAQQKALTVLARFGDRQSMRDAVRRAPWHLMSTMADFEQSGLCLWGTEVFLRRIGMLAVARHFGLPRFLLRMAGPYGVRLTACSILRARKNTNYQGVGAV